MNDIYIIFVILHSRWSGNAILCYFSIEKVWLFIMQILSCVMIARLSSICLIALKIFGCTLAHLLQSFILLDGYQGCILWWICYWVRCSKSKCNTALYFQKKNQKNIYLLVKYIIYNYLLRYSLVILYYWIVLSILSE